MYGRWELYLLCYIHMITFLDKDLTLHQDFNWLKFFENFNNNYIKKD